MRYVVVLELGPDTTLDQMEAAVADLQDIGYTKIRVADDPIANQILESINPPKGH